MGEDWNLVLDPNMDYCNYKHANNPLARDRVENMILNLGLMDIIMARSKYRVYEIYLAKANSSTTKPSGFFSSLFGNPWFRMWSKRIPVRPFYDCSEIFIWKQIDETKNILEI